MAEQTKRKEVADQGREKKKLGKRNPVKARPISRERGLVKIIEAANETKWHFGSPSVEISRDSSSEKPGKKPFRTQ